MRRSSFSNFFVAFFLLFVSFSLYAKESADYAELIKTVTADEIEEIFTNSPELKNSTFGQNKETLLMLAVKNDRPYEIIEILVNHGCKITAKSKDKRTVIMFAARFSSDPKILEFLIQESAITAGGRKKNVNAKDSKGITAFDYATLNPNPEVAAVLESFSENKKSKKEKNTKQEEPEQEEPEQEETTSEKTVTEETTSEKTVTEENKEETVPEKDSEDELLSFNEKPSEEGKDISQPDSENNTEQPEETPAAEKTENSKTKVSLSESLFDNSTFELSQDDFVNTTEYSEQTEKTPSEKKTVQSENKTSEPEEKIPSNVQSFTKSYLFDYITDNTPDSPSEEEDKFASVKIENVDHQDKNGITLLMKAAKTGNDWDVQNLLKNGANVQLRDKDGWSALMYAVRYQNNMSIVQSLIDYGAHVRVRNKYNSTPLLMAANYSHNPQILELLLQNRNASEDEVYSAFILALTSQEGAEHVQKLKIQLFLDLGISVNRMWKGKTPLMYACQYGNSTQIIQMLIDYGAKVNMQNQEGKTAFDYAGKNRSLPHDDIYWSLNSISR